MFAVAAEAEQFGDDQLRAVTGAGAGNSGTDAVSAHTKPRLRNFRPAPCVGAVTSETL